jgi:hypothetical protein
MCLSEVTSAPSEESDSVGLPEWSGHTFTRASRIGPLGWLPVQVELSPVADVDTRFTQLALAVTVLLTAKLIDWRNRWSPAPSPIR